MQTQRHRRRHANPERAARRVARRDEFLDAAVAVIRRDGPGATMSTISAEMGVTKPVLYRYFGDRDGLVTAVAQRFSTALLDELRATLASGAEPRDLLVGTIDAYLGFVEREPQVYRFLIQGNGSATDLQGFIRQIASEIALVIGEGLRARGHDSAAAEPWAFGIVGMVHLAGDWWVEHRSIPRARLVEYLTTLLWDGMASVEKGVGEEA